MIFNSKIVVRQGIHNNVYDAPSQDIIKNETMFFNSDLEFAYKNGNDITRSFINSLPPDWTSCNPVLDSRVHMLMNGWFPCIPGWHHDDVPRNTPTGQPNYIDPEYRSEHLCCLVNAEICPTNFLIGDIDVSDPDHNSIQYNIWDNEIQKLRTEKELNIIEAKSGELIQFDCDTFHTGTRAVKDGWRWFIRLSRNTERQKSITNEIRRQVQVYIDPMKAGW